MSFLSTTLLVGGLAFAQEAEAEDVVARVRAASQLPEIADDLRGAGVAEAEVRRALEASAKAGMKGAEVAELMKEGREASRAHGPVDNFGAFVQARLDEGLRGQDLAAAIRAEHEARGKKHGPQGGEHGKPEGPKGGASEGPAKKGAEAGQGGPFEGPAKKGAEAGQGGPSEGPAKKGAEAGQGGAAKGSDKKGPPAQGGGPDAAKGGANKGGSKK